MKHDVPRISFVASDAPHLSLKGAKTGLYFTDKAFRIRSLRPEMPAGRADSDWGAGVEASSWILLRLEAESLLRKKGDFCRRKRTEI